MIQATEQYYVVTDQDILSGEPIVRGTRTPVRVIVELWRIGLPHLTLAQIFGALSYYSDHREEILRHIARNRIAGKELTGG